MAHNQGFYQGQGQPVQQQQQYSPVFQQPQNIYQQLGKPQPQPHLQRHPTYTAQQAQQQPIQPQGFQFAQPQYVQGPPQPMQAPYALTQTPYASPQTPYPPSQTPYIPSHTPFTSQTPYPASQPQYAPAQIPYPPPPTPQQYPIQQQQVQPVYTSHAPPQISRVPTSSFPNPTPSAVPTSSSGSSWRASIPRPPPVSPSASLAQQAQAQAPPIQVQSTPQTPQTSARRPLPQPSPGANAQPPALPPANAPQRIPTLSSIGSTSSGTARPFPIQPIQTTLPQSSKTPSPTRSRPLPTPTEPNKRATVDLGKLPHSASGAGPSLGSASNSTFNTTSASSSNWPPQKREQSPTRPLPSVADRKQLESSGLSRTSSYAVNLDSGVDSPPKRRTSPPRFQSQPSSTSNSPVKESSPITSWNSNKPASGPINSTASSSAKFINSNPSNSSVNNLTTDNTSSSTTAPPKKFVPMWKRTIPEMPAPAWGYAAGMVSEPHPKPKSQPALATTQSAASIPSTKGNGKLKKISGAPSQSLAAASIPASPTKSGSQYQPEQQQHSNILNSEYPRSSAIQQRYPLNQQQSAQYTQVKSPNNHAVRGYTSKPQHEEGDDDDEEEEEETEDDGEEEEEETEESEEDQSDHRYVVHTRHHGKSQNGIRAREQSRGRYEHEDTPKKKVLRPKVAVDPYAGYTEASPSSKARRERQETYPVVRESPTKITLRPKVRTSMTEDDERTPKKIIRHARSKSAFEEREVVSHRRDPGERDRPRPGSAFAGPVARRRRDYEIEEDAARLAYEDSEEDDEEESEIEWKKTPKKKAISREVDRRQGSGPQYGIRDLPANRRSGSGSGGGARYSNDYEEEEEDNRYGRPAGRDRGYRDTQERDWGRDPEPERGYRGTGAGLPQPPAMAREPGGGAERKVRGGPRLKSAPLKFDDYEEEEEHRKQDQNQGRESLHMRFSAMNVNGNGSRSDSRGSSSSGVWPADLPRLPRTPGSATTPGSVTNDGNGYFDAKPQPIAMSGSGFGGRQGQGQENMNRNKGIQNRRTNLDLDDPPPRATVIRTPSPGPSGYTLKRELPQPQGRPQSQVQPPSAHRSSDLDRRRSLYSAPSAPIHGDGELASQRRPQSQIYGQMQPSFNDRQPAQQQQQQRGSHLAQYSNHLSQAPNNARHQPQTPAPPPTVGIESPHPVGGRDKLADIPKLEEDSNHGSDTEGRGIPRIRVDPSPTSSAPRIQVDSAQPSIPMINVNSSPHMGNVPMINVEMDSTRNDGPKIQIYEVPGISVSGPGFDDHQGGPSINISGPDDHNGHRHGQRQPQRPPSQSHSQPRQDFGGQPRTGGLICGGCNGPIIGRIVSAMGSRWHPACFKCTVCSELLEHVSSYEHEGRPYCHLDYHENFAPRCYTCETAIIEEQFISLDDPALGKRAYHTQHFFCAECGDPFLSPSGSLPTDSKGELALSGDGEFEGFTVYKGHPYCEACHVRLRLPKCKRCKRSIRDNDEAVEALGGKWCWGCFVCASCEKPFEDPSFFQRGEQPFCEHCFSIMLRNEI